MFTAIVNTGLSMEEMKDMLEDLRKGYDTLRPDAKLFCQQIGYNNFMGITSKEMRDILSGKKEPYGTCPGCDGKFVEKRDWMRILVCENGHELPFSSEQWMDLALTNAVGKPRWERTWGKVVAGLGTKEEAAVKLLLDNQD